MGVVAIIGIVLGGAYVGLTTLLVANEGKLLFPTPEVSEAQLTEAAATVGAEVVRVATADGEDLYGWRIGDGEHLALMFSGNGASVGPWFADRYQHLNDAGFTVLHVNYRGYPGSTGKPSEKGLLIDARAIWAEATQSHLQEEIVLFGTSLGGGVALALATQPEVNPRAMVLESTFLSVDRVAQKHFPIFPIRVLMRNRFNSAKRSSMIDTPAFVVHGAADGLIPPDHGRQLAALLHAPYIEVEGHGHNAPLLEIDEVWSQVLDLVQ